MTQKCEALRIHFKMELPRLPKDIWVEIGKWLELDDAFNLYRAGFTTYDFRINEYLPLLRMQEWKGSIMKLYPYCWDCFSEDDLYSDLEESDDSDSDSDYYSDNGHQRIQSRHDFALYSKYQFIYLRNFIYLAYRHNLKVQKLIDISDDDRTNINEPCVFHDDTVTYKLLSEIYSRTLDDYRDSLEFKWHICIKCGETGHKEYDEKCLFSSRKFRAKYLEKKRLRKQAGAEQERLRKKKQERKRKEFMKIACVKCCRNQRSTHCESKLCGACCVDDNCNQHCSRKSCFK